MSFRKAIKYLRLKPYPLDTEEGRASERYRVALWTILTNALSKSLAMLVVVLSVNWTLPYLGVERFGVWMTVASFVAMLSFLDLGIGNAMTNRVAHASAHVDSLGLRKVISGGLGVLALLALFVAVLLGALALTLPWESLIKFQTKEIAIEVRHTVLMFAMLFALTIWTSGMGRVLHGLQRGYEVHFAGIAGSILALVGLAWASQAHWGLPHLLAVSMGGPIVASLGLGVLLYRRGYLSWHLMLHSTRMQAPGLLQTGGLFLFLQVGTMVGWGADSILIANINGAAAVAVFSVTQRLTQFVSQPLAIMNAPLWAAYAEASARNDKAFIRQAFGHSFRLTFALATVGALILLLFGRSVIEFWTHSSIVPGYGLLMALSAWLILESTGNALGVLLNGLGVVRQQVFVVTAFIVVALPLKLWWGQQWGAEGVVCAGIVAYTVTTVFGYGIVFRRRIAEKLI